MERLKNIKKSELPKGEGLPWLEVSEELFNYIKKDLEAEGSMVYNDVEVFVKGKREDIMHKRGMSVSEINHGIKIL